MSGAAPAPKQDELVPHPVKDQLSVAYCINSPPPWPEAVLLGFQHYLVMLGTTVIIPTALVPQMGGGNDEKARVIQTLLFVAGINTLLQSCFGTCLPAVIGGSYSFVLPTISIILARRYNNIVDPHEKFLHIMRGTQGALIVASTLQIVVGFSGLWRNITRFLSPLSAAPVVALAGFGLYELGFPGVAKCVEVGLPVIIVLVIFSQYVPQALHHRKLPVFERFAVIFSILIVWFYAYLLTIGGAYRHDPPKTQVHCRTDRSGLVGGAPWIRVPYPFQWGAPSFNAGEAFAMMAASLVGLVESTGTLQDVPIQASQTQTLIVNQNHSPPSSQYKQLLPPHSDQQFQQLVMQHQPPVRHAQVKPEVVSSYLAYATRPVNPVPKTFHSTMPTQVANSGGLQPVVICSEVVPFSYGSADTFASQPPTNHHATQSKQHSVGWSSLEPELSKGSYMSSTGAMYSPTQYNLQACNPAYNYSPSNLQPPAGNQQQLPSADLQRDPQLTHNHPYGEILEKAVGLGYDRDLVSSTVRWMVKSGQAIDFSSLINRLNQAAGASARAW